MEDIQKNASITVGEIWDKFRMWNFEGKVKVSTDPKFSEDGVLLSDFVKIKVEDIDLSKREKSALVKIVDKLSSKNKDFDEDSSIKFQDKTLEINGKNQGFEWYKDIIGGTNEEEIEKCCGIGSNYVLVEGNNHSESIEVEKDITVGSLWEKLAEWDKNGKLTHTNYCTKDGTSKEAIIVKDVDLNMVEQKSLKILMDKISSKNLEPFSSYEFAVFNYDEKSKVLKMYGSDQPYLWGRNILGKDKSLTNEVNISEETVLVQKSKGIKNAVDEDLTVSKIWEKNEKIGDSLKREDILTDNGHSTTFVSIKHNLSKKEDDAYTKLAVKCGAVNVFYNETEGVHEFFFPYKHVGADVFIGGEGKKYAEKLGIQANTILIPSPNYIGLKNALNLDDRDIENLKRVGVLDHSVNYKGNDVLIYKDKDTNNFLFIDKDSIKIDKRLQELLSEKDLSLLKNGIPVHCTNLVDKQGQRFNGWVLIDPSIRSAVISRNKPSFIDNYDNEAVLKSTQSKYQYKDYSETESIAESTSKSIRIR